MKFDGSKLKKVRLAKGYRQSDIAALTKQQGQMVDSRTLSHWENSPTANPRPKNLSVVARVLETAPETFYISESEAATQGPDAVSGEAVQPAHIRFWEALGYVIVQEESGDLILQSSGRRKDISLSQADLERIYTHVKRYTDFFISEYFENQRRS